MQKEFSMREEEFKTGPLEKLSAIEERMTSIERKRDSLYNIISLILSQRVEAGVRPLRRFQLRKRYLQLLLRLHKFHIGRIKEKFNEAYTGVSPTLNNGTYTY